MVLACLGLVVRMRTIGDDLVSLSTAGCFVASGGLVVRVHYVRLVGSEQ